MTHGAGNPWWRGTVGYEVYTRSYADANGDGIGDLAGITSRLDHIAWLGADAVWITPFYPSPGFDHGYDVADYTGVNPIHGSMADFEELTKEAHGLGLRVIIDIVPNHSSSHHPWFQEALKGRDNPYRDYYVWRDPAPGGGPPNNWVSHFGGPAWTLDEASGQYYCHLFLPEQPDLNWENPQVADEFDAILRFWCDRGADGFRIDVAHGLKKDQQFRDNPRRKPVVDPSDPWEVFASFEHKYDMDQDGTVDVYRRWNRVVEPYGAMLIGEVGTEAPNRIARYVDDGRALHTLFYLKPSWMDWEPEKLLDRLRAVCDAAPEGISWVTDNHDNHRSATRFGGGKRGADRSLAVFMFMAGLGGMPFLYQGQELGIEDGEVEPGALEDPVATRNEGARGRDGCRTVMPWGEGPTNGFSLSSQAWLRSKPRPAEDTVAGQQRDPASMLHRTRRLLEVRKDHPDLYTAPLEWLTDAAEGAVVAAYRRGGVIVAANWDAEARRVALPEGHWRAVIESRDGAVSIAGADATVAPETTVFLTRE